MRNSKMASHLSHFTHKTSFFTSNPRRPSPPCMSVVLSTAPTQSYWASIDAQIDAYLNKSIPIRSPESVFEPMHHLTFAAPRTTAASLCVAACEPAIHLMHAAAYTHEHLPLTDRPRPRPGIQHKYNPNIELLTGDGIIPFGLELLARSLDPARSNPDKILRVIVEITRATGSQGMVDGQYQELGLDQLGSEYDVIEYVCKKKEGELHACGAACGAILGGGAEEEIESLRRFGLYAGMVQGIQGKNKAGFMEEKIEKFKELALKELESLQGKKTELISSLVEPSLAAVQIS
ncbi:heterodimeric geranylgeranyl pyrophosphate synthase small subunit, chloroplastic-like [Sesamum indicum]|uniref:Heterodimeric geranylgeranyl pyrophosphate synthase small subunit, chloroplastic-like n=1 Tax=Sesamum indicum TaxID=4182 RepID=A0A6I9U7S4_SESIN|nr:heterodimeric geranylgeranyl pyrophosphate synthase small subunit, chloroplastic-like [Sesamum indicum]